MILLINNDIFLFEIKFLIFQFLARFGIVFIYSVISIRDLPDSILVVVSAGGLSNSNFETRNIKIMPRQPYILSQFLRLLPRYEFQLIVNKYKGDYHTNKAFQVLGPSCLYDGCSYPSGRQPS